MGKFGNSIYYTIIIVIVHVPSLLTNESCSYNHLGAPNKIWMTQILCIEFDFTKPLCNMGSD